MFTSAEGPSVIMEVIFALLYDHGALFIVIMEVT